MKSIMFFVLGATLAWFLQNLLDIPLWLELVIVALVALILWAITKKKKN
jgi:hypothetical protein